MCRNSPCGALRAKITPSPPIPKFLWHKLWICLIELSKRRFSLVCNCDVPSIWTQKVHTSCITNIARSTEPLSNHFSQSSTIRAHRALCSGVKLGVSLLRSSIKMKSFPRPSYFANSMVSPVWAATAVASDLRTRLVLCGGVKPLAHAMERRRATFIIMVGIVLRGVGSCGRRGPAVRFSFFLGLVWFGLEEKKLS